MEEGIFLGGRREHGMVIERLIGREEVLMRRFEEDRDEFKEELKGGIGEKGIEVKGKREAIRQRSPWSIVGQGRLLSMSLWLGMELE